MLLLGGLARCSWAAATRMVEETQSSVGQLALPLVTQGASGVTYRLREATFAISRYGYYEPPPGTGGATSSGGMGSGGWAGGETILVSSEDDPDSTSISVSVEEGEYYVQLLPGWHFEKEGPTARKPSKRRCSFGETQWVWVHAFHVVRGIPVRLGRSGALAQWSANSACACTRPSELGGGGGFGGGGAGAGGAGGFWERPGRRLVAAVDPP